MSDYIKELVKIYGPLASSAASILVALITLFLTRRQRTLDVRKTRLELAALEAKTNIRPPEFLSMEMGPLTIIAVLKGQQRTQIGDAYPIGEEGGHCLFNLFNRNPYDLLVQDIRVEVLAYEHLQLDHFVHGVGATDVTRFFYATIEPRRGTYGSRYEGKVEGEYVTVPPEKAVRLDVAVSMSSEGVYDLCLHVVGTCGSARFDAVVANRMKVAFFDPEAGYQVKRGLDEMVAIKDYLAEMKNIEAARPVRA